ncbi:hypothetical protein HNQ68_002006 [Pseudochrobactrum saccharolyticum]|uniref:PepSY domain-containing protein n=2 Tax=Brucellaceae TaxID=118882 RepID=A0A7W8ALK5_9HYPH|nr:hypothetical protein [Pseudochrobactrum saccharolyticum]
MMKLKLITLTSACIFMTASAFAQSGANPQSTQTDTTKTPAIVTPDSTNPAAPVKGENSFTEDQAKEKIESAGFTEVKMQNLDTDGIWHATAQKAGASVNVLMDYQGNVTTANP